MGVSRRVVLLALALAPGCAGNGLPEGAMALTFGGIATDDGGADTEAESTSGPSDPGATSTSPGMSSDPGDGSSGSPTDDAPSDASDTFDPTTGPSDDATTGPGDDATTGPGDDVGSSSDGGCLPGVETCNGIDDDCDDEIDESDPMLGAGCGTGMPGICAEGTYACDGGNGLACEPNQSPQNETCNGVDDDCDGTPDDEGCGFPCSESDLGSTSPQSVGGSTAGEDEDVAQSCGGAGVEHLMTFTAPSAGTYTFNADGSSYDTVISVHADCSGTEIACNDDDPNNPVLCGTYPCSQVSVALAAGEQILVAMSGFAGATGAFTLNISGP